MFYCGVTPGPGALQLCALEEVRLEEPPVRLHATFFEPGGPDRVAAQLLTLEESVVAVASPASEAGEGLIRAADAELERRGVPAQHFLPPAAELYELLTDRILYAPARPPEGARWGQVAEGAYRHARMFETNVEGVFCALQGRRLPARRHPLGVQRRIDELSDDMIVDAGGELWHRRIEEIEAAAAALCAHRYAVGHACWLGDPAEAVLVLPGSTLPERFGAQGVVPPVPRAPLAGAEPGPAA